jgi:hypothetical protein
MQIEFKNRRLLTAADQRRMYCGAWGGWGLDCTPALNKRRLSVSSGSPNMNVNVNFATRISYFCLVTVDLCCACSGVPKERSLDSPRICIFLCRFGSMSIRNR